MKFRFLLLSIFACVQIQAQTNLIPDGGFEEGNSGGGNSAYYYYEGETLWRAWPYIVFDADTVEKRSGSKSLKIRYLDYGSGTPSFRPEVYPELEPGKYRFSFYYKTDIDRSGVSFNFSLHEGKQGDSQEFGTRVIPMVSEAKDDFVELSFDFNADEGLWSFFTYIQVPYIADGTFLNIDDVRLVKLLDTPKAYSPSPFDTEVSVDTSSVSLIWQPGNNAIKRNVYFGSDSENLNQIASEITETSYNITGLDVNTTYYWRVDEIDDSDAVSAGDIWSFKTKTFYDYYMSRVETERIVSDTLVSWKQFGPGNAGFVNFLRYHPLLPDICITSPDMYNTYQTENNGESWYTVKDFDGKANFSRLRDMYYSSKTAAFAIAIESSHLWVSQDTGRSWTTIKNCPWYEINNEGYDGRSWYDKVSAVALDPNDDDTWYVGAGFFARGQQHYGSARTANALEPNGVDSYLMGTIWKTTDAGQSWETLSTGIHAQAQFSRIVVHPRSSDTLFAASTRGLFRSDDAGETWDDIGTGKLDNNMIMDMDFYYNATSDKFVLYVIDQVRYYPDGETTRNDGGIFKSLDNGDSWTNINGNLGVDINRLSGGCDWNYYGFMARWFSKTRSEVETSYPEKASEAVQYFNMINIDPSKDSAIFVSFYDAQVTHSFLPGRLWKTSDGGQTWINTARYFAPAWAADSAYWKERNNPFHENIVMGHEPYTQQWRENYPLRSCRHAAVNSRGDVMILFAHNTLLSTDNGDSFMQVDEDYTLDGNIMGHGNSNLPGECMFQDKRLGEGITLFGSGEHHLWISTNDGTEGRQAAKYLRESQESVFAVVTHPWDENTVYTTSMRQHNKERIFKSTDRGESFVNWGKATEATEWMRTNHIRIDPVNPENMYFGVTSKGQSGGGGGTAGPDAEKDGGFHRSTNAGKSFSPSNSGLPEKPWVRDIEFDPRDPSRASLFIAAPYNPERDTDGGLYYSEDKGVTWTEIHINDKIKGVNNVLFDHTGRLYATSGRRYASYDEGGLFYSDDYGDTWTKIFESKWVENIDVSPFNTNVIALSHGTLSKNPGVFLSLDRGETWSKNNRTLGQPDKLTQIEFDLNDPTLIWASVLGSGFARGAFPAGVDSRKIWVTPGDSILDIDASLQLSVDTELTGALLFKSDNDSVANVSNAGLVTGVGQGAAKIWVSSEEGPYSDFHYLVVNEEIINASKLDHRNSKGITCYPNPASDDITVLLNSTADEISTISIYSVAGNSVYATGDDSEINGNRFTIDIENLNPGIYWINVQTKSNSYISKFIKSGN